MLCTIIDIRGDYAYVKYDQTGVVSEVAIALLPFGVDVGDRLKFEDFEFTITVAIRQPIQIPGIARILKLKIANIMMHKAYITIRERGLVRPVK